MSLKVKIMGAADVTVVDGEERIAEIRGLKLIFARFRPGGTAIVGETVPLFLFWMQYANHQDPDRNAGAEGRVEVVSQKADQVVLQCLGTTASGVAASSVVLTIRRDQDPVRYCYAAHATLDVRSGEGWLVTPNPTQGEVEFCNLWPEGAFSPNPNHPKKYQACYLVTSSGVASIPHHHVESPDKHNIPMIRGDRFLWLQEDENPCLTIQAESAVTAGLCAYMWDAHFAYKVCTDGKDVLLPNGSHFEAAYELTSLDKTEVQQILARAENRQAIDLNTVPMYIPGVNPCAKHFRNVGKDLRYVWPWEPEENGSDAKFGFDDSACLSIDSRGTGFSQWKLATFGPAFGGKPFVAGCRYRVSAFVKTSHLKGKAMIAVRLHKEGHGSVFDLQYYETFVSEEKVQGDSEWSPLRFITPVISPAPDRLHLLLIQEGSGTTLFRDVSFEVLS
ncbi:MAG: hypothetical protein WEB37_11035 [Bacteroidota bacterium]